MESIQSADAIKSPKWSRPFPSKQIVQLTIQLVALAFLLSFCFNVISPFIMPFVWGSIFAIALYPLHVRLKKLLGGRGTLASVIVTIVVLAVFILPGVLFTLKTAREAKQVLSDFRSGNIHISPPAESVKGWPLIGSKTYNLWMTASSDLNRLITENPDKVKSVTMKGVDLVKSTAKGLLLLTFAIIISGVLLAYSLQVANFARSFFSQLMNSTKVDVASIATITIRNVVKGILGVAVIQSALAGAGMWLGGIPYVGIWTLLCLILAIVQVGTAPVAIGVIIYAWSGDTSTTSAIFLTIWMIVVGLLDNFLKPIIMGKGAPVPMLVIFLGAIGGFIFIGFIGMFTGAVVLSLGYRLFDIWLKGIDI
jgi:predicted PurR-regulated permease PerM